MKTKKYNIYILLIIVVILTFGIITIMRNILNGQSKEVKSAQEFIELLIEKEIIDENKEELLKKTSLNQSIVKTSKMEYSVILGNYAVDIDNDFNIIGFSNKNLEISDKKININQEEAILLAKNYAEKILDSEFLFKEVKEKDEENNSHYSVVFYNSKDGYPVYRQEINMVIDKYSGKLDAYSNNNLEDYDYINNIKYNENEIKKIMNDYFLSINKKVASVSNGMLAYVNNNDEYILSYVFTIVNESDESSLAKNSSSKTSYDDIVEEEEESDGKVGNEEILIIRTDNGEFINLDESLINK